MYIDRIRQRIFNYRAGCNLNCKQQGKEPHEYR